MKTFEARERGFTLIELLIVVAIIGIIAALLVPNFLDALNKGRQKRTLGDMYQVGEAMAMWATDNAGAAAAGAPTTVDLADWTGTSDLGQIRAALAPDYAQHVPRYDAWGYPYQYRLNLAQPSAQRSMLIGSGGRDGSALLATYTIGRFPPDEYDQDIIWADGRFLRQPDNI